MAENRMKIRIMIHRTMLAVEVVLLWMPETIVRHDRQTKI